MHSKKNQTAIGVSSQKPEPLSISTDKPKKWTPNEEDILKRIFSDPLNKMGLNDIAQLLSRSKKAVERKKEKMLLGSSRQRGRKPKSHLTYPERNPGASLDLIPAFQIKPGEPYQPFLPFLKGNNETPQNPQKPPVTIRLTEPPSKAGSAWSLWDIQCLQHYWGLRALGITDVATFLRREPTETQEKAQELKLPEKPLETPTNKYQISQKWNIELETVVEVLSNDEQHALAELTATRLSHLKTNPHGTSDGEKEADREINNLFEVQRHIFHRAIRCKARKLARIFHDPISKEAELIQVGESALYHVISRWDPSQGINFCRATVAQNIERQMQQWIRKCRVVQLPTGLISEIVEERRRINAEHNELDEDSPKKTPQRKESIARYLFSVHPDRAVVPLNESYEENDDNRHEQMTCGRETNSSHASIVECEHQSFVEPQIERENLRELIGTICQDLPEDEKNAFCEYHGIGEDGEATAHLNLRELAAKYGVSAERIRQRINLAKDKMAKKLGRIGIHCSADAF